MTENIKGNQGKISIFKRIYVLFHGRFPVSEKSEEGVLVKGYKRQLAQLNTVMEKQAELIDDLTSKISTQGEINTQDKLLNMLGDMFLPKKQNNNNQQAILTEFGNQVNEPNKQQIIDMISQYDSKQLKMALGMGDNFLAKEIRKEYPTLSDKSISEAIEIIKEKTQ